MNAPRPDHPGWLARLRAGDGLAWPVAILLFVLFLLVPLLPGEYWTVVATEILILGLFAMSFNLLYGYMGQISFGHAAFFGVGAYATAMLFTALKNPAGDIGVPEFLLSLLAGPPVAALAALFIGFFCVRLTGITSPRSRSHSARCCSTSSFLVQRHQKATTASRACCRRISSRIGELYHFTLVIVALALFVMWRITESPFGWPCARCAIIGAARRSSAPPSNAHAGELRHRGRVRGLAGALWGPFSRSVNPVCSAGVNPASRCL